MITPETSSSTNIIRTNVCQSTAHSYKQPTNSYKLPVGGCLSIGNKIESPNGKYVVEMKSTGRFEIITISMKSSRLVWKSHPELSSAKRFCIGEKEWALCDGDKVVSLYWQDILTVSHARIQDDGNFVLYTSSEEYVIWSSDTYGR